MARPENAVVGTYYPNIYWNQLSVDVVAGILEYSYPLMSIKGCYTSGQSGLYHLQARSGCY